MHIHRRGTRTAARLLVAAMLAALLPWTLAAPASAARSKSVKIADASVIEGNTGSVNLTFTISWNGAKGGAPVSVSYATADGSAVAGADYTAKSGTVTLSANGCRCATVTVAVLGDTITEGTEDLFVNLSNPQNATIVDGRATGTIYDNEGPPALVVADASAGEAAGTITLNAELTNASAMTVTVDYATADTTATAGADYTATSGTLTFSPGQTTKPVSVTIANDALSEDDETLLVNLTNASGATIADAQGIGTITDDDPDPTVDIANASVAEGDTGPTDASFTVTLSAPAGREVAVDYATADGSATAGTDYTATSGTLTFPAGTTSAAIDVPALGDFINEGNETFTVSLSSPSNATLGTTTGTGTIVDDDTGPMLSIADATVTEGEAGTVTLTFPVTLAPTSGSTVTVDYTTTDGSAVAGTDYTATSGTLTFLPGASSANISVDVAGDTVYEGDETFTVNLSNATNAKISLANATGTITENDPAPSLSVADASVTEGNSGSTLATFTVTLTGATAVDASASWATVAGTATAGADFQAETGSVLIPAGQTSAVVKVTIVGDTVDEPDETFSVTLSSPGNASIADGMATGTILDDDKTPTTLTLKVATTKTLKARGLLEPAVAGLKVTVTLYRKSATGYKRVRSMTVTVKGLKDRDGDGKKDARYVASFTKPKPGAYMVRATFKGTSVFKKSTRAVKFKV